MNNIVYQITQTYMLKAREGSRNTDIAVGIPRVLPKVFTSREELEANLSKYREKAEKDKNISNCKNYFIYDFIEKDISSMSIEGDFTIDEVNGGYGDTYYYPVIGDFCLNNLTSYYNGKKVKLTVELID